MSKIYPIDVLEGKLNNGYVYLKGDKGDRGEKGDKGEKGDTGMAGGVNSVNGRQGDVIITKAELGLQNVDNTSDANKPLSNAAKIALDSKQDALSFDGVPSETNKVITAEAMNKAISDIPAPMRYIGPVDKLPTRAEDWQVGNVIYVRNSKKEYVCEAVSKQTDVSIWRELGDEGSYALKTDVYTKAEVDGKVRAENNAMTSAVNNLNNTLSAQIAQNTVNITKKVSTTDFEAAMEAKADKDYAYSKDEADERYASKYGDSEINFDAYDITAQRDIVANRDVLVNDEELMMTHSLKSKANQSYVDYVFENKADKTALAAKVDIEEYNDFKSTINSQVQQCVKGAELAYYISVVSELPTSPQNDVLYFVKE